MRPSSLHGEVVIVRYNQLYLMLWRQIQHFALNDQPDQLIWKWNSSGIYTAKSCYIASPPRVSFSTGLPTKTNVGQQRGGDATEWIITHDACPFSRQVWHEMLAWLRNAAQNLFARVSPPLCRVFDGERPSVPQLIRKIQDESAVWGS